MTNFRTGTQPTLVADGYTNSTALGAAQTVLPVYTPSPNNELRGLYIQCVATTSGNSATPAFNGDGPWITYAQVTFQDANQKPILGPVNGYDLMVINKYGGFQFNSDPRASAVYSVTTGSGGSAGSYTFVLYVPVEVNVRGWGSLQNQSSDSTFSLLLTLNTEAAVYATNPTSAPTVVTTIFANGWWKGNNAGASPTPSAAGTTQYFTKGSYSSLNGTVQQQLSQGLGYTIRLPIFENYDVSNSTRATGDSDFPTTTQLIYKGTSFLNISKTLWKDVMSRAYGFTSTTADSANGLENGVYVLPWFAQDFSERPGNEIAMGYLNTNQGDLVPVLGYFQRII